MALHGIAVPSWIGNDPPDAAAAAEERGDPRVRVLEAAEPLFMAYGYNAIALRDIAERLGIKQASLYYHFPQGKEELYVAVAERAFARHQSGLRAALASHRTLREQLRAVARWFAGQPGMCLMGMVHADLPALGPAQRAAVTQAANAGLFQPLAGAFEAAQARGEIGAHNPYLLAGAFLALLDGLGIGTAMAAEVPRARMADRVIDLLLDGARTAPAA